MSTRAAIVDALRVVPGIAAVPAPPDLIVAGTAWPMWTGATMGTQCALLDAWTVVIVLPNATMTNTIEAADQLVQAVWAALLDIGEVSTVAPVQITASDPAGIGQLLPALAFSCTIHSRGT